MRLCHTYVPCNPCASGDGCHLYDAGRVCMAAFVGWLVAVSGFHFPGLCSFSEGVSFEDLSKLPPLEQWSAVRRAHRANAGSHRTAPRPRPKRAPSSELLPAEAHLACVAQLPALGKQQIIAAIGIIEHQSEWKIKPHYMRVRRLASAPSYPRHTSEAALHTHSLMYRPAGPARLHALSQALTLRGPQEGGAPGSLKGLKSFWDPVGFTSKLSAEKLERQRLCELKNGRLAMIGIASVLVANTIPGSIPLPITFPDSAMFVLPF